MMNQIYVPNTVIGSMIGEYFRFFEDHYPEMLDELQMDQLIMYENIVFLLADPLNLVDFAQKVMNVLPDFWAVSDLSNAYAPMIEAMSLMREIADGILIVALITMFLIIFLLCSLFLYDRKKEIGIYLALGEQKSKIATRFLLEVSLISVFSIILALVMTNIVAPSISNSMMRNNFTQIIEIDCVEIIYANTPEALGFRHEISPSEMLETFNVSMNGSSTVLFFSISLATIIIASTIPLVFMMRRNAREILVDY